MSGLILATIIVLSDSTELLVRPGLWLKSHRGPDAVIVLIFFLSGLALDTRRVRDGLSDHKGTALALLLIFIVAPVLALLLSFLPLEQGVIIGLLLVSAMPTTLSSGVVMTGSSGGNMAHSLFITILANALAVVTIPVTLALLLAFIGDSREIEIDQLPIMLKIATLVLLPLLTGIIFRRLFGSRLHPLLPFTSNCNQIGILIMVWMALCGSKPAIMAQLNSIFIVIATVFVFHLFLSLAAIYTTIILKIPKGRKESLIFMGGQKTLPLSVILQVSIFPEYGIALVVCVMHHIVHLVMDAYLVGYLKSKE